MITRLTAVLEGRLTVISWEEILRRCGSPRVSNVALLGAAAAKKLLPFSVEELEEVVKLRVPPLYLDMNIRALRTGMTV
jgi:indolepyruvate ferredoxin oxidoreductase beta subunit